MNRETPVWLQNGKIDEIRFCQEFLQAHQLVYCDGAFFGPEGRLSGEEVVREQIFLALKDHITSQISRRVEQLLGTLRLMSRGQLRSGVGYLHLANGTLDVGSGDFLEMKVCCRCRLPVNYNPKAPAPAQWLDFLSQLLEPEDILTLQEYMGYCLIPTTAGQKMLMIVGSGGEGKSRIGVVMRSLLGDNMNMGSIAKVETSPFARADLQHKLLLVDDDLKMEALTSTHYLKSIITAELPMDLERKGVQSYQGRLHVRFLAFGNGSLRALHDRSYGFFRRQIVLTAKPRDPNRVDNPFLGELLQKEKEGILLWCLEGLERLVLNQFRFTISREASGSLSRNMRESNNILMFLESQGYFRFDPDGRATSRQLYSLYRDWCEDNMLTPFSPNTFWNHLSRNAGDYSLRYSHNIPIGNGKTARGFYGIRALSRF